MQVQHNFGRRTTDTQIYDRNHRQKIARRKVDERKNTRTEKNDRADRTEHLPEEEQKKHNTGGTNFGKRKMR